MPLSATTQDNPVAASGQAARTDSRSDTSLAVYLGEPSCLFHTSLMLMPSSLSRPLEIIEIIDSSSEVLSFKIELLLRA